MEDEGRRSKPTNHEAIPPPLLPARGDAGCRPATDHSLTLKLRRGLAASRKAGPGTPSPSWKVGEAAPDADDAQARRSSSASARQLGATLWEIQHLLPLPGGGRSGRRRREQKDPAGEGGVGGEVDQPKSCGGLSRHEVASAAVYHKLIEKSHHVSHPLSPVSCSSSFGAPDINEVLNLSSTGCGARSRKSGCNLKTLTELLKVLNRIWSLEEQHSSNVSLIKALKVELEHAHAHIQELTQASPGHRREAAISTKNESKQDNRVKLSLKLIHSELEDERRLRRHFEGLQKKLEKELSELKPSFLKSVKDLEKERKANNLLEELCDEFAKGIKSYEEEVRYLKGKNANDFNFKLNRSIVHISEAWLDQRMQLQITNAHGDLVGRSTVLERLHSDIHAFLQARRSAGPKKDVTGTASENRRVSLLRQSTEPALDLSGAASAPRLAEDDDSAATSDFQCFDIDTCGDGNPNHDQLSLNRRTANLDSLQKGITFSRNLSEAPRARQLQLSTDSSKVRTVSQKSRLVNEYPHGHGGAEAHRGIDFDGSAAHLSYDCHAEKGKNCCAENTKRVAQPEYASAFRNNSPLHCHYLGGEPHNASNMRNRCCEGATSEDLPKLHSPSVQQLNYPTTCSDAEISECSPMPFGGVKENTLKAKLLQARLEGRHARLKAFAGMSGGNLRKCA